jgi:hypothetical protein
MTTKARKRTKNSGLMKIGVWNVRGLYGKEELNYISAYKYFLNIPGVFSNLIALKLTSCHEMY